MTNVCENNLEIVGPEKNILALKNWLSIQSHPKAPDTVWAALYNLEKEAESYNGLGVVGSGKSDHSLGNAELVLKGNMASFKWSSKNYPSIDSVLIFAKMFPSLNFFFSYSEPLGRLKGSIRCMGGEVESFEGGFYV